MALMSEILMSHSWTICQNSTSLIVGSDFNEAPNLCTDRFPARGNQDNFNPVISDFCNKLSLLDALRILNMVKKKNSLKLCLEKIISVTQSGFMKSRHISNNIQLVLDILDYKDLFNNKSLILFVDFYKAFYTVEYSFIVEALQNFSFNENFTNFIGTFYRNINSCVSLAHGTSPRFEVNSARVSNFSFFVFNCCWTS